MLCVVKNPAYPNLPEAPKYISVTPAIKANGSSIKSVFAGRIQGRLPAGYTEVEWIGNTNHNQKLVIPINAKTNQYFGLKGKIHILSFVESCYLVTTDSKDQFRLSMYSQSGTTGRITNASVVGRNSSNGGWMIYSDKPANFFIDTLHVETDISSKSLVRPLTNDFTGLTLFAETSQTRNAYWRLYPCQVLNGNDMYDIVPCLDPNGEPGVYYFGTNTFIGNSGTDTFDVGPEVLFII